MKKMSFKELVSKVALTEGKKLQTQVGNVREVLSIVSDLIVADPAVLELLISNGKRRARRK